MLHKRLSSSIPLINVIQGLRIAFMLWLRDANKYNIPIIFDVLQLIIFAQNVSILTVCLSAGCMPVCKYIYICVCVRSIGCVKSFVPLGSQNGLSGVDHLQSLASIVVLTGQMCCLSLL